MIDRQPREGYGFGIIRLSYKLAEVATFSHVFALIEHTDVQGHLKEQGILDQIRQHLLLPDEYRLLGAYIEPPRLTWCLLIEAPGVPIPDEGEYLPVLTPVYEHRYNFAVEQVCDGKPTYEVYLVRVDISRDPTIALRVD